jgi:hypothetical protein
MRFYHSLINLKQSGLNEKKLKRPIDFIEFQLDILALIVSWGEYESQDQVSLPYLYIDTDRTGLHRTFIVKSNQIISFAFPLDIVETDNGHVDIHLREQILDAEILSICKSMIKDMNGNLLNLCGSVQELDMRNEKHKTALKLIETLMWLEPSYLRFDHDPQHESIYHPANHIDFNFSLPYTYKIGVKKWMKPADMEAMIDGNKLPLFIGDSPHLVLNMLHCSKSKLQRKVKSYLK